MRFPWEKFVKRPSVGGSRKTPLIYYGGKTLAAEWIVGLLPPHEVFVDCFGGGAAVTLAVSPPKQQIYNDIGNVSVFFKCLRDWPNELYRSLYFTPYSRQEFWRCRDKWSEILKGYDRTDGGWPSERDAIEWARCWFVQISQSYKHQEDDPSWLVSKGVNTAVAMANHVDDLPFVADRFRRIVVENKDFRDIIKDYDGTNTCFYADPPYVSDSRSDGGTGYRNEMSSSDHGDLIRLLCEAKGQAIISGYDSSLYRDQLDSGKNGKWRRVEQERTAGIHNSSQEAGKRTEICWIKEHHLGLFGEVQGDAQESPNVARVQAYSSLASMSFLRERKTSQ